MAGILYGVGVGPGDPELMTLKAIRLIRENDVIACPGKDVKETAAYRIAAQAVPELEAKELLSIPMPMVMDREEQEKNHRIGAAQIERILEDNRSVVFLTLGDPAIYSTFSYLQHFVEADGYEVRIVSGVPSFCAAAAACRVSLAEREEPLHILPAVHGPDGMADLPGTCVLMKAGSSLRKMKENLRRAGRTAFMAENCGMPDEKLYRGLEEIPDEAGYFSLIIAKEIK